MNKLNFLKIMTLSSLLWGIPLLGYAQTCKVDSIPASTPKSRFINDDLNATVLDKQTGLMWKKCSEGQDWNSAARTCQGTATEFFWWGAFKVAESANKTLFAGYVNWRLPNVKELASIVENQCREPSINSIVFPNTSSAPVWSSSPIPNDAGYAYSVSFLYGGIDGYGKSQSLPVRLVRDTN